MKQQDFLNKAYKAELTDIALEIFKLKADKEKENTIEFLPFSMCVIRNNDAFLTLWEAEQIEAAITFIRLQAELFVYLYAELLYPERIIKKVFLKSKTLEQIKIKGEQLKQSDIRAEIVKQFPKFTDIWNKYHTFIHPSFEKGSILLCRRDSYFTDKALSDIIDINRWIMDTYVKIKGRYKKPA